jgi:phospholipid/cholesterol/gamma-HCH transport system substrate-binding protein
MLRRTTKIQLILFVVITLLGISYVSAEYVGLAKYVTGDNGCKISADFPDSGGIFSGAEVTYRGVTVGNVGALHLQGRGIRVDLHLNTCSSPKIPANSIAVVADRSVVGEQYVNLIVPAGARPSAQSVVAQSHVGSMNTNKLPTATQTLLTNMDRFVNSLPLNDLRTVVSELGTAVNGRGGDLQQLLDASDALLATANDPSNVDATIALIDQSATVLQTQLDLRQPLSSFTHSLNLLSQQLKASDPDIRRLLDHGPADLATIQSFITTNRTDLGVTLANLVTVGDVMVRHLNGIEEVLELYPALAALGPSIVKNEGGSYVGELALVLQTKPDPQDCGLDPKGTNRQGYEGTQVRYPNQTAPITPNVAARCTGPSTGPNATNVRGSANVPGGDPISISGGDRAYDRAVTKNVVGSTVGSQVAIGPRLPTAATLGDGSWLGLLTASLH